MSGGGGGGATCFPLAVEMYGNCGNKAQDVFTRLASLRAKTSGLINVGRHWKRRECAPPAQSAETSLICM